MKPNKQYTIALNEEQQKLLDKLAEHLGDLSTPTQILRSCAVLGMNEMVAKIKATNQE